MNILRILLTALLVLLCSTAQTQSFDNTHLIEDASNGDPQAQYTLAHLYLKGKGGIEFDVEEAGGAETRARVQPPQKGCVTDVISPNTAEPSERVVKLSLKHS